MKKLIAILTLTLGVLTANAHQRITPLIDINQKSYDDVVKLIQMIERISYIEKIEGKKLSPEKVTTDYGEFLLERVHNAIKITPVEFTSVLEKCLTRNHQHYNIDEVRTELLIQNANLFEYISQLLSGNARIKNMVIEIDKRTGGSYIRVSYFNL